MLAIPDLAPAQTLCLPLTYSTVPRGKEVEFVHKGINLQPLCKIIFILKIIAAYVQRDHGIEDTSTSLYVNISAIHS